jgi:hypothetical protein
MKEAWRRVRVPIVGLIGVVLITLIAFAVVKPEALAIQKPAWTITGNAVLDDQLFDARISQQAQCAPLEDPICATDQKTYSNLCEAQKHGVDMLYHGPCTWTKE